MASNNAIRFAPETIRTRAFGSISGTYAPIGQATASSSNNQYPLLHPARQFLLQNFTDVTLTYSWDGVNDHLQLPSMQSLIDDVTTNHTTTGGVFCMPQGQIVYVKGSPGSGQTNLTVFYGAGA